MKKSTIYGIIWAAWFGASLGLLGVHIISWKYWAIIIPIITFVVLEKNAYKNE